MISSRLLSRKLGDRNQDSCCKENLLLEFFFKMVYAIKFQGVLVFSLQIHHFAPFSSPQFIQKQQLFHLGPSATMPSESVWCQTVYSWLLFIFVQDVAVSSHPTFKSIMTNNCFLKCLLNTVERLFSALAQWDFSLEPETLWSLGAHKAWVALQNLGSLPKALFFFFLNFVEPWWKVKQFTQFWFSLPPIFLVLNVFLSRSKVTS